MNHKGTQTLYTDRLKLRKVDPDDAEMVFKWMSDPEVIQYEIWQPHPHPGYTRGYIKEVYGGYQSDKMYHWGIERGGELIGSVSVVEVNDFFQKALMGYNLRRDCWSEGYATEAVREVLRYMFEEIGINRIEATHSVNNPASGRVLEKVGMNYEGYAKEYYICNLGVQDSKLYAMTRSDYKQNNES